MSVIVNTDNINNKGYHVIYINETHACFQCFSVWFYENYEGENHNY